MTIIFHPIFKFTKLLNLNPDNTYIVDQVAWIENANKEEILTSAQIANSLVGSLGAHITKEIYKADADNHKAYQVAVMQHPVYGTLRIAIVAGPDYELIKSSLEPPDAIIDEKATFKLNVHPTHETVQ